MVDCGDDFRSTAIVALLAPLAQQRYDDGVGHTDPTWQHDRTGFCLHDISAAQDAVKCLFPGAAQSALAAAYSKLEGDALRLLYSAGTWPRIELVARELFKAGSMDANALSRALMG